MGSKTIVGSLKRSRSDQGTSRKKMMVDDEPTSASGLKIEESSEEDDSRIISDGDDISDGPASEDEEDASSLEEGRAEVSGEDEESISDAEEDVDMSDSDESDDDEGDDDDDDEGDDDEGENGESDDDGVPGHEKNDDAIGSSEGVDLSDSDDEGDSEGDHGDVTPGVDDSNDVKVAANPAWAQALAKILRTQKPTGKKAVVLSKARTIPAAEAAAAAAPKVDAPDFEIIGDKTVKPKVIKAEDVKPTDEELIVAKRQRLAFCRVKQEKFDFNRERALAKIATRGVVQLFNAVRAEQKTLGSKLAEAHSTRLEDKILKSIDKNSFLEHLTGKIRSQRVEDLEKKVKIDKDEAITLPKSWDELSKSVELGKDSHGWDRVIEIKEEPED